VTNTSPTSLHQLPPYVDVAAMVVAAAFGAHVARSMRIPLFGVLLAGVIAVRRHLRRRGFLGCHHLRDVPLGGGHHRHRRGGPARAERAPGLDQPVLPRR